MPGTLPSKRREAEIYRGTARLPATASNKHALIRLFTDFGFARRVVRYVLGLPVPLETEDRRVLEQVIFRHFLRLPNTHHILFVGCDWYTNTTNERFSAIATTGPLIYRPRRGNSAPSNTWSSAWKNSTSTLRKDILM
jgi:hypothetical protein